MEKQRVLVYINGSSPDEVEEAAWSIYHQKGILTSFRNARFWKGETEKEATLVLTDAPGVRAAYEKVGVKVNPITPKKRRGRAKKSLKVSSPPSVMLAEPED